MIEEESGESASEEDASVEDLIEQSRALMTKARSTLERADILVVQAQTNRCAALAAPSESEDTAALMHSLRAMQRTRTELVTAIQQATQAMHLATRYVQSREKFIQARVEWSRQHGK